MRLLWTGALLLLGLNVLLSAAGVSSFITLPGFRFPAESLVKPLLLCNGALLVSLLLARRVSHAPSQSSPRRIGDTGWYLLLVAAASAAYLPSLGVNYLFQDWTHRHVGAMLTSVDAVRQLFLHPQVDGMYRPLGFLSFWLDYRVFGATLWGYHIQSIALHALNAVLVCRLALDLGWARPSARTAAILFAVAAAPFEAVLWPAARFDLLACALSLLAILCFLRYWRGGDPNWAALCLVTFAAGVLTKETAYSTALLLPVLALTHVQWNLPAEDRRRGWWLAATVAGCAVLLLAVRFALYRGAGGYAASAITLKSLYLWIVYSLALPVWAVSSSSHGAAGLAVAGLFVAAALVLAFFSTRLPGRRKWALVTAVLLSAAPAISVIGGIQPSLVHGRHLYWPLVWTTLLLALFLEACSRRALATVLLVAAQFAGLSYNLWISRRAFDTAGAGAARVVHDLAASGAPEAEVRLTGVPVGLQGVYFLREELQGRIQRSYPRAAVQFCPCPPPEPGRKSLAYTWDSGRGILYTDQ